MNNHNVYSENRNIEKNIKNGRYRALITFPECSTIIDKLSFENTKIKEGNEEYPYNELIINTKSPFRIGIIIINKINITGVLKRNRVWSFDTQEFTKALKIVCKKYKGTIIGLPIEGPLQQFRGEILKILNENVRDTKVVLIEN